MSDGTLCVLIVVGECTFCHGWPQIKLHSSVQSISRKVNSNDNERTSPTKRGLQRQPAGGVKLKWVAWEKSVSGRETLYTQLHRRTHTHSHANVDWAMDLLGICVAQRIEKDTFFSHQRHGKIPANGISPLYVHIHCLVRCVTLGCAIY